VTAGRFLKTLSIAIVLIVETIIGLRTAVADTPPASPKGKLRPLLVLMESNGWGPPSGPWPYGLRLAVYEDGQIIFSPDPEEQVRQRTPRFFWAKLATDAARKLADDAAKELVGVPETIRGDSSVTDMGWTTILVWRDGVLQAPQHAYAYPCQTVGRAFEPDSYQAKNRAGTDQRFLDLCDRLSTFTLASAAPWQPQQLMIQLQRGSGDKQADWPDDWGPPPGQETASRPFCIDLVLPRSHLTDLLVSDLPAERESAFQLAVLKTSGWWEIGSWQYPLPGEIAMRYEGYSPRPIFKGACDSGG
jgi:hypothetical protein